LIKKEIKNIAASVRARLINIADESKRDYNAILRLYFQERFLYRLSISNYKPKLILKGALLLMMNDISKFRPTKDIDFLGKAVLNEMNECKKAVKEIASIDCSDGVKFMADKISIEKIKEDSDFEGVRVHLPYKMDTIKGYLSIDIGFGDKIVEGPYEMDFPILLDFPSPRIFVYSLESAVAEKYEAIVKLNFVTSRMKDFYDIIFIAERTTFSKIALKDAILVTFKNRGTNIEDRKTIYDTSFKQNFQKQIQWSSFLKLNKLTADIDFSAVVDELASFIEPIFDEKTKNNWDNNSWKWI
jgi:predicted nucleotidyltransferase component of viral defense system